MADFFDKNQGNAVDNTAGDTSDLIQIGEKSYSQDQLNKLVQLGEIGLEAEEKYSTDLTRVWPEYTKKSQTVKELEGRIRDMESVRSQPVEAVTVDEESTIREAKAAAKKLGIVTQDDFDSLMSSKFRDFYAKERSAERLLEQSKGLEATYNGKDGRPRFNTQEVLEYMQDSGVTNPETAYKLLHETAIDSWKEQQLRGARKSGMITEGGGNSTPKAPSNVKITRDNIGSMIAEQLGLDND